MISANLNKSERTAFPGSKPPLRNSLPVLTYRCRRSVYG